MHYQGRVTLIKKRRPAEIAKLFNDDHMAPYWNPTSNNAKDKAAVYCMKADSRLEGPWIGPIKTISHRLYLHDRCKSSLDINVIHGKSKWKDS